MLKPEDDFYSKAALKTRGWTEVAIRAFLSQPDLSARNPCYRSAPPMQLYLCSRVHAVEASPTFREWLTRAAPRKRAAKMATETKRTSLMAYVEGLVIQVPSHSIEHLMQRACDSFNARAYERDREGGASLEGDPRFLARITVNYLRHELTRYEHELSRLYGKVGTAAAYPILKKKVLAAIATKYPDLEFECDAQAGRISAAPTILRPEAAARETNTEHGQGDLVVQNGLLDARKE